MALLNLADLQGASRSCYGLVLYSELPRTRTEKRRMERTNVSLYVRLRSSSSKKLLASQAFAEAAKPLRTDRATSAEMMVFMTGTPGLGGTNHTIVARPPAT